MRVPKAARNNAQSIVLGLAMITLLYSVVTTPPSVLVLKTSRMLASSTVSMSASVSENPDNTLYLALKQREAELNDREAALIANDASSFFSDNLAVYSFMLSIILFLLLAVNYLLDWKRGRRRPGQIVIS